jgi:hypothetical protein
MKEYPILIDLSSPENIKGLKFNSDYYIDSVLNTIDSISEGQGCVSCSKNEENMEYIIPLNLCSNFKKHNRFALNILTNKIDNRVKKIYKDLENKIKNEVPEDINYSIKIEEKEFNEIYKKIKSYKYIILGENIHSYFAAYQNENDIEDVIISGFQYGHLNSLDLNRFELKPEDSKYEIYEDKSSNSKHSKLYIDNPLMKSEFISYTNLDYLDR